MKKRCFIAIRLPLEATLKLHNLIQTLKQQDPSRFIKYVRPENIHVTLHFLGYRTDQEIQMIDTMLKAEAERVRPFTLSLGGISEFPDRKSPKILFIEGRSELNMAQHLQKNIGEKLESIGVAIDRRPWVCHLTIARIGKPIMVSIMEGDYFSFSFQVSDICLMESILRREGAEYRLIAAYSFQQL